MSEYKNQHYVPQIYLKQFIDLSEIPDGSNKDSLWVYNKNNRQIELECISKICSDDYLYSFMDENGNYVNDLEKWLSSFEIHFRKVLNRSQSIRRAIINKRKIDWYQRCEVNYIVDFILFQYFRIPKFLNSFIEMNIEGFKEIDLMEGKNQDKLGVINDIKKNGFPQIFDMSNKKFQILQELIVSKNLYVTVIPDSVDRDFCICDCPVLITNQYFSNALIHSNTEITIPLTKKIAVSFYEYGTNRVGRLLSDKEQIDKLNSSFLKISQNTCCSGKKDMLEHLTGKDF
jgi:hypothetical protein